MTYNNYSHFTNLISFNNVIFECIIKFISIIKLFLKNQYLLLNITIYGTFKVFSSFFFYYQYDMSNSATTVHTSYQ